MRSACCAGPKLLFQHWVHTRRTYGSIDEACWQAKPLAADRALLAPRNRRLCVYTLLQGFKRTHTRTTLGPPFRFLGRGVSDRLACDFKHPRPALQPCSTALIPVPSGVPPSFHQSLFSSIRHYCSPSTIHPPPSHLPIPCSVHVFLPAFPSISYFRQPLHALTPSSRN